MDPSRGQLPQNRTLPGGGFAKTNLHQPSSHTDHHHRLPSISQVDAVLSDPSNVSHSFAPLSREDVAEVQQVLDLLLHACVTLPLANQEVETDSVTPQNQPDPSDASPLKATLDDITLRLSSVTPSASSAVLHTSHGLTRSSSREHTDRLLEALRHATVDGPFTASKSTKDVAAQGSSSGLPCGGWQRLSPHIIAYAWRSHRAARRLHAAFSAVERQLMLLNIPPSVLRTVASAQCIIGGHRVSVFEVVPLRDDTDAAAVEASRRTMLPRVNDDDNDASSLRLHHESIPLLEYIRRTVPCTTVGGGLTGSPTGTKLGWLKDGSGLVLLPAAFAAFQCGCPMFSVSDASEVRHDHPTATNSSLPHILSSVTPSVFCTPFACPSSSQTQPLTVNTDAVWRGRLEGLLSTLVLMTLERQPSMLDLPPTFVRDCFHSHGVRMVFLRFVRLEVVRRLQKLGCGYWGVVHKLTTEAVARTLKTMCREHVTTVTSYANEPAINTSSGNSAAPPRHKHVMEGATHSAPLPTYMNRLVSMFLTKPKFVTDVLWPRIASAFPVVPFLSTISVREMTSSPLPNLGKNAMFLTTGHAGTPAGPSSLIVSPSSRAVSPATKPLMPTIFLDNPQVTTTTGVGGNHKDHMNATALSALPQTTDGDILDGDASEFDFAKVSLPDVLRYLCHSMGVAFSPSTKQFEPTLLASEVGPMARCPSGGHLDSQLYTLPHLIKCEASEWELLMPEVNRWCASAAMEASATPQEPWADRCVLMLSSLRPLATTAAFVIAQNRHAAENSSTVDQIQKASSSAAYELRRHSGFDSIVAANSQSCGLSQSARRCLVISPLLLSDVGLSEAAACDRIAEVCGTTLADYASLPQQQASGPLNGNAIDEDDVYGATATRLSQKDNSLVPQRALLHWAFDVRFVCFFWERALFCMLYRQQLHLSPDSSTRRAVVNTVSMCAAMLVKCIPFTNSASVEGMSISTLGVMRLLRIIPALTSDETEEATSEYYEQRTSAPEPMMKVLSALSEPNCCALFFQLFQTSCQALLDHQQLMFAPIPPTVKKKVKKPSTTEEHAALTQQRAKREGEERRARQLHDDSRRHSNKCVRLVAEVQLLLYQGTPSVYSIASAMSILKFIIMSGFGCGSTVPNHPNAPPAIVLPSLEQQQQSVSATTPLATALQPQGTQTAQPVVASSFSTIAVTDVGVKRLLCSSATSSLLFALDCAMQASLASVVARTEEASAVNHDMVLIACLLSLPHVCKTKESAAEVASALADVLRVASFATKRHVESLVVFDGKEQKVRRPFEEMVAEATVEKVFESEDWLRMIHEVCMEELKAIVESEKMLKKRKSSVANLALGRQQRGAVNGNEPSSPTTDAVLVDQQRVKLVCQYIMGAMEASPSARDLLADVEVVQYPMHRGDRIKRNVPAEVMSALVGGPTFTTGKAMKRKSTMKPTNQSHVMILRRVPSVFGVHGDKGDGAQPEHSSLSPIKSSKGNKNDSTRRRRQSTSLVSGNSGDADQADPAQTLMVQSTDEALKRLSMAWALRKQQKEREKFQKNLASFDRSGAGGVTSNNSTMRGNDGVSEALMHSLTKNSLNTSKGNRSQQLRMARAQGYQTDKMTNAEYEATLALEHELQRRRKRAMEDRLIERWKEDHPDDELLVHRTTAAGNAARNVSPTKATASSTPQPSSHPMRDSRAMSPETPPRSHSVPPAMTTSINSQQTKKSAMPVSTSLQRVRENARAWAGK